jgi:hypothetical protein
MKENKFKPGELITFEPASDLGLDLGYAGKTCMVVREIQNNGFQNWYEVFVDGHVIEAFETWLIRVESERV